MNSARRLRVLVATLWVAIAVLVLRAIAAPPARLTKEQAIAQVEQLGGKVRIDGEAPGEPVWMVDFTGVTVDAAALDLLTAFPTLDTLHFEQTALGDDLLKQVGNIHTLKELSLAETKVTDAGLKHLLRLSQLERLNLSGTQITNEGLQQLVPLQKLTEITFAGSGITPLGMELLVDAQRRYQPRAEESREPEGQTGTPDPGRRFNDVGRLILLGADRQRHTIERGVEQLERAVIASPDNDQYKLDLADAYAGLRHDLALAAALDLYEDVLARRPDDEQLLGMIAKTYCAIGNQEQAQEALERRLLLVPVTGVFDVVSQLVGVVATGGDRKWAIQQLRTATRKAPSDRRIPLLLAGLLAEDQQLAEARKIIEQFRQETSPDHPLREAADELLASLGEVR